MNSFPPTAIQSHQICQKLTYTDMRFVHNWWSLTQHYDLCLNHSSQETSLQSIKWQGLNDITQFKISVKTKCLEEGKYFNNSMLPGHVCAIVDISGGKPQWLVKKGKNHSWNDEFIMCEIACKIIESKPLFPIITVNSNFVAETLVSSGPEKQNDRNTNTVR